MCILTLLFYFIQIHCSSEMEVSILSKKLRVGSRVGGETETVWLWQREAGRCWLPPDLCGGPSCPCLNLPCRTVSKRVPVAHLPSLSNDCTDRAQISFQGIWLADRWTLFISQGHSGHDSAH